MRVRKLIPILVALFYSAALTLHPLPAKAEGARDTDGMQPGVSYSVGADGSLNPNTGDEEDSPPVGGGGGGGDSGMVQKMVDALTALPQKIAETMMDMVFNTWGIMISAFLGVASGVLGTGFLQTFYPGSVEWIAKFNGTLWILCLVLSVLFLTMAVLKVLHGRQQVGPVLLTFGAGVLFSVFSMQVVNFLVWVTNTAAAALAASAVASYSPQIPLELKSITADQIISMPYQDPDSFGGQLNFHNLFLDPVFGGGQAEGGIIALVLAAGGWMLLIILTIARLVVLAALAALAPLYISMVVWSSRIEPLVGWLALTCRTVGIQLLWVLGWQLMVFIQVEHAQQGVGNLFGLGANIVNVAIPYVLAFATLKLWFSPAAAAIAQPLTLAGGHVIDSVGNLGTKAGGALAKIGSWTGNPAFVAKGRAVAGAGAAMSAVGRAAHGGRSAADRLGAMSRTGRSAGRDEAAGRYWTREGRPVIIVDGLPVEVVQPPAGWTHAGEWRGG